MKKLLPLLIVAAVGYAGYAMSVFSSGKVAQFLDALEDDVNRGRTDAACERLDDNATFTLSDTTGREAKHLSGDRDALCSHFADIAKFYANAAVADNHGKSGIDVSIDWLHPGKASVSYDEHHAITFYPAQTTMNAVSHETLGLVKGGDSYRITSYDVKAGLE